MDERTFTDLLSNERVKDKEIIASLIVLSSSLFDTFVVTLRL